MKTTTLIILVGYLFLSGCATQPENSAIKDYSPYFQVETGKPVGVMLTAYSTTLIANGTDITELRIALTDSLGREIKSINRPIEIYVYGDAKLLHPVEGKELVFNEKYDSVIIWQSSIENGLCSLFLQAGTTEDKIKVEARCDTLWPASHELHTLPRDIRLMQPGSDQIKPTDKEVDKMIGADISFLPQLEARGVKFYDNSIEKNGIQALKDHGFNYIRLRIFVNPENEKGYSPEEGFCGLDYTKQMAKRTNEAGMKLLLNFHYSDYWADPQRQYKPKAWEELGFEELKVKMKDYTKMVINELIAQGTPPDMVQVGNEINHGMLWPDGHISNLDNLAELICAGLEGVQEADSSILTMIHLALGGQNQEATFWLDNMLARNVDFDVLGISYYSRWHGTLNDLNSNLNKLISKYGKPINVVEYSGYKSEVHEIEFSLPDGMGQGTCIWEPLNTWGAIFDRDGNSTGELALYDEFAKMYLNK
ncbi:MAG TPA: glycosyl hydrolase 53 family protein [Bacteroidales bacterium]|nr:glycosyl hydrolase 53 family protein [Bacteroidales bacterium]